MSQSTGTSGINAGGDIFVYTPPKVTTVMRGDFLVSYGPWVTLPAGEPFPNVGVFEIEAGSGELVAMNMVVARTVTIT